MTQSPAVKFGMAAMSVALNAKTGQVRDRDVIELLAAALEFSATDRRVRNPILAFCRDYHGKPVAAGSALHDFICTWMRAIAPEQATHYDWQERADLR